MRKLYKPIVGTLTLILLLAPSTMGQNQGINNAWKTFRNTYPYHIQCVGLTEPDEAGLRLMIIAEPPPHVTLESLRAVNPSVLQYPKVRFQKIGYDGWVADVIFVLPAMSREALKTMLDQLNHHLYGTAYKASVLALPTHANLGVKRSLDLRVPAGELGEWVLGDLAHPKVSRVF